MPWRHLPSDFPDGGFAAGSHTGQPSGGRGRAPRCPVPSEPRKGLASRRAAGTCTDTGSSQQNPLGTCLVGQPGLRESVAKEQQKSSYIAR